MTFDSPLNARRLGAAAAAMAVAIAVAGPAAAAPSSASPSASVANGTLTITGTNRPDRVGLDADSQHTLVVTFSGSPAQSFDRNTFSAIRVSLFEGDDELLVSGSPMTQPLTVDAGNGSDRITTGAEPDVIFGGNGDDVINSGAGNDIIDAGNGSDVVNGGTGSDVAFLGAGNDRFIWNPGDGSDTVEGQSGTDTLEFNGSNANEIMSLSPNGRRAVLRRDVGSIVMDLGGIEHVDAALLGGADAFTVNDLSGTDVKLASLNLANTAGAPDGFADTITVNGTDRADHVTVGNAGAPVVVRGLTPETRITGSEPADHLQVNTLAGNDKLTIDGAVLGVIGVGADLGTGQV